MTLMRGLTPRGWPMPCAKSLLKCKLQVWAAYAWGAGNWGLGLLLGAGVDALRSQHLGALRRHRNAAMFSKTTLW